MLNLPTRTKKLLEESKGYYGFVLSSIQNLSAWISDNKTVFFSEYTDHGFSHLNEVLITADSIISDASWSHLTPQDAAAMVVSVLLHDCAMHLSEDGFYTLINDEYPVVSTRYFGPESKWSVLWNDFMGEAKRFDAKKLLSIFGDETPVRDVPKSKIDLTNRDRMLIGEFVRRHHARLAHEIAFNGVPGFGGKVIKLAAEPEANFLDLCGFIARSHNLELRSAVDKLERFKKQVHLNTHVPFVMLVLRISDYIQIHSERAPERLLNVKGLSSPVSRGEWKKHSSIVEINQAHTDPEALYVDAEPEDALTFEAIVFLLRDIQRELDNSWSVLGEVYGRFEPLTELGITIRRIRSSLDDVDCYVESKSPDYIPRVLRFRTADSEMMELLVSPLYGDNPEVGVRELMQNAIDACVELNDLVAKQQIKNDRQVEGGVSVVLIDNGDDGGEIVIQDHGVGMTLDIVENYFLNIGASFRNSDRWRKDHETQGHSNVYRTGRFGIGLLAAYLLGDELKVETRHANEPAHKGLSFSCKKGSSSITLLNVDAEVGTKISISLSKDVVVRLGGKPAHWDWFSLAVPRVQRKIIRGGKEVVLEQARIVPGIDSPLEGSGWFRTVADGFDDVVWTYQDVVGITERYGRSASLICNGVIITDRLFVETFGISKVMRIFEADIPSINVFDQDGRLPINLQRTDLVGRRLPFMNELARDLSDYLVREILAYLNSLDLSNRNSLIGDLLKLPINGLYKSPYGKYTEACKFIISGERLLPMDYDLIAASKIDSLCVDAVNMSKGQGAWNSLEFVSNVVNYLAVDNVTSSKQSRSSWVRVFFELYELYTREFYGISSLPIVGRRILIKKSDVAEIVSPGYVPKTFWNRLELEWENDRWALLSIGKVPDFSCDIKLMCDEFDESSSFAAVFYYMDWACERSSTKETSIFSASWINQNEGLMFSK